MTEWNLLLVNLFIFQSKNGENLLEHAQKSNLGKEVCAFLENVEEYQVTNSPSNKIKLQVFTIDLLNWAEKDGRISSNGREERL